MKIQFIILISTVLAAGENLDNYLFESIYDIRNPVFDAAEPVFHYSSMAVGLSAWSYLLYMGLHDPSQEKIRSAKFSFCGVMAVTASNQLLKAAVRRNRPRVNSNDSWLQEYAESLIKSEKYSFPSQTASLSFFTARYFSNEFGWGPVWYTWAFLTGWSRIYAGDHYPGDITGGAVLGYGTAWAFILLKEKTGWFSNNFYILPDTQMRGLNCLLGF